ncbi:uncharacterized protein MYCFIDRAFT_88657 [Pseudocercospora fijiensis CIRAD86]|uniref:Uncharacterized protein n=1 Tax=Pseudocercospora fijiensis (strain CIRAD86) TaxID=383855 RepID=M3A1M6_PSEFD|nr:uncharacterized protein MYCFIDRAFT_88657 [Pseudocercospora fijiensis CIRAD86]EME85084.1 hypothetical protein MYCFIDRAFT_88657 [Pseudocercospora fijiensis CIRAD86]
MPPAFPKGAITPEQLAELDGTAAATTTTTTTTAPPPPPPPARRPARPAPSLFFAARKRPSTTTAAPRPPTLPAVQVQTGGSQPVPMAGSSSSNESASSPAGGAGRSMLLPTTVLPYAAEPSARPAPAPQANSEAPPDYKKLYLEVKAANDDLYVQLEKRDSDENSATKQNERLRDELRQERSNKAFVDSVNADLDRKERERRKTDEDIKKEREWFSKQRADFKKQSEELQRWADSLQSELNEEKEARRKQINIADDLQADLTAAQTTIDSLTRANEVLSQQATENDKAAEYLKVVSDNLEQVFKDQGKDLNPDSFGNHLKRLTEQAEINQQSSQVSLNEKFNNDAKLETTSKAQRNRQTSLSEDLARTVEGEQESPDNSTVKPDTRDYDQLEQKIKDLEKQQQDYVDDLAKAQKEQKEKDDTIEKQQRRIRVLLEEVNTFTKLERSKPGLKPIVEFTDSKKPVQVTAATQTAPLTPDTPISNEVRVRHVVHQQEKQGNAPSLRGLIFIIFLIFCFMTWIGHYGQLQGWRNANLGGYHDIQYSNSKAVVYGLRSRFEKLIGLDTTLLG